jgi:hypothetical protein
MLSRFTDADYHHVISRLMAESDITREDLLTELNDVHGCDISMRTLDRIRTRLNLTRNTRVRPSPAEVVLAIERLQEESDRATGIVITMNGVRIDHPTWHVTRDQIASHLQSIDPRAVAVRADVSLRERIYYNDGPNDCWHIDQNDKLKPFGFPLHAGVDGYSRRILWLVVTPSNNNPRVIVNQYLSQVERVGGCPRNTRSDHGSENNHVAAAQRFLRLVHLSPEEFDLAWNCHVWGPSTSNTRVESVWSRLKSEGLSYWRKQLLRLQHDGCLRNEAAVRVLQRMIVPLIQQWLDRHAATWNRHRIRRSLQHVVEGAPNRLYTRPPVAPAEQCLIPVSQEDAAIARQVYCPDPNVYTAWMTEEEQVIAEAAIEKQCKANGIQRYEIDNNNWQQMFRDIVTDLTHQDIEMNDATPASPLPNPSSSLSSTASMYDISLKNQADNDDSTNTSITDNNYAPMAVEDAQTRPLHII